MLCSRPKIGLLASMKSPAGCFALLMRPSPTVNCFPTRFKLTPPAVQKSMVPAAFHNAKLSLYTKYDSASSSHNQVLGFIQSAPTARLSIPASSRPASNTHTSPSDSRLRRGLLYHLVSIYLSPRTCIHAARCQAPVSERSYREPKFLQYARR